MAVYELTLRFEAEDDREALAFAVEAEQTFRGEAVLTPMSWVHQKAVVERVTRVLVT